MNTSKKKKFLNLTDALQTLMEQARVTPHLASLPAPWPGITSIKAGAFPSLSISISYSSQHYFLYLTNCVICKHDGEMLAVSID